MAFISRGFHGRRPSADTKLPPGRYETTGFPVLSAGPTPYIRQDDWKLSVTTEAGKQHVWDWAGLMALPTESPTVDLHCVTKWSKFGTEWQGVSLDVLLADVETAAEHVLVTSDGGYTTNIPFADLVDDKAWIAYGYGGSDLAPEHGGPARLLVPHLGSPRSGSARSSCGRATCPASGRAPATTTTETHGENSGTRETRRRLRWRTAEVTGRRVESATAVTLTLDLPGWPGHLAGQHVDVRLTAEDG